MDDEELKLCGEVGKDARAFVRKYMELRKDAERLDYIAGNARCDPKMDGQHVWWPTSFNHRLTGPTLRDAIDAAMAPKRDGAA